VLTFSNAAQVFKNSLKNVSILSWSDLQNYF
jgi:hypothetical protein